MSCVADATAMINPTEITKAKFNVGLEILHKISENKMIICINIIHPLL